MRTFLPFGGGWQLQLAREHRPGRIAGTISVSYVQDGSPGATRVTPRYDVTSLSPEGVAFVKELEAKDTAFSEEWRAEILAGLASEQEGEAPAE